MLLEPANVIALVSAIVFVLMGGRIAGRVVEPSWVGRAFAVIIGAFVLVVVFGILANVLNGLSPTPGVKVFATTTPFLAGALVVLAYASRRRR